MIQFILKRLILGIFVIFVATLVVFLMARLSGDPRTVYLDEYATQKQWDEWGEMMGLDKPIMVQYGIWAWNALRGDFGNSTSAHRPAFEAVVERIPATLQLTAGGFAFAMLVGIPLGVLSAVKRGSGWDYMGRTFALFGQALPPFWIGIMGIMIFSIQLELLPFGRRGDWTHYVLPSITLGWLAAAGMLRLVRSAMLDSLDSEYVRFARAKGVSGRSIVWKHAFRNALIAPLTYAGLLLAAFITGAVITETVFAWPGLGRLAVQSVMNNDFPVLTAVVVLLSGIYLAANLIVDVLYAVVDPRIRLE